MSTDELKQWVRDAIGGWGDYAEGEAEALAQSAAANIELAIRAAQHPNTSLEAALSQAKRIAQHELSQVAVRASARVQGQILDMIVLAIRVALGAAV